MGAGGQQPLRSHLGVDSMLRRPQETKAFTVKSRVIWRWIPSRANIPAAAGDDFAGGTGRAHVLGRARVLRGLGAHHRDRDEPDGVGGRRHQHRGDCEAEHERHSGSDRSAGMEERHGRECSRAPDHGKLVS